MNNKYIIHKICNNILNSIETNENDKTILKYFKALAEEIQDPFVSGIDEFLKEKEKENADGKEGSEENKPQFENQEDNPQDNAIDELKEEAIDYKAPVEQNHPQDEAVDTLKEEAIDYKAPVEQDHPQDEAVDKVIDEVTDDVEKDPITDLEARQIELQKQIDALKHKKEETKDAHIESSLKNLGLEISKRGHPKIGTQFLMAASAGILEILNNLLQKEFLIKDILDNYGYLYTPEIVAELATYRSKEVILYLQKQIVNFGGSPTTQRLGIPTVNPATINPPSINGILVLIKEHDADLVRDYIAAINALDVDDNYLTLKVIFTKIIENKTKFVTMVCGTRV